MIIHHEQQPNTTSDADLDGVEAMQADICRNMLYWENNRETLDKLHWLLLNSKISLPVIGVG